MSKSKATTSAAAPLNPSMTVKEFAEWLLANHDHDLPVYKRDGGGDFQPLDRNTASDIVNGRELMRMKDAAYTADTKDTVWAKRPDDFHSPFKAVVVWSL